MDYMNKKVDYIVYESALARMERINKRLFILLLLVFMAFISTNVGWIIYESKYEDSLTVSQDVDTGQAPAYVNGTGSITVNGKDTSDNN